MKRNYVKGRLINSASFSLRFSSVHWKGVALSELYQNGLQATRYNECGA
jgi:hypothetical protein